MTESSSSAASSFGTSDSEPISSETSSSEAQAHQQGTSGWRGPNASGIPVDVPADGEPAADDPQGSRDAPINTGQAGDPTAEKDPDDWVTGDEPATGAQVSYLETLARKVGRDVPERLTKADASRLIDELQSESSQRP